MNVRFVRFLVGAMLFFYGISDHAFLHIIFWLRATGTLAGAYLLINIIQNSDEK